MLCHATGWSDSVCGAAVSVAATSCALAMPCVAATLMGCGDAAPQERPTWRSGIAARGPSPRRLPRRRRPTSGPGRRRRAWAFCWVGRRSPIGRPGAAPPSAAGSSSGSALMRDLPTGVCYQLLRRHMLELPPQAQRSKMTPRTLLTGRRALRKQALQRQALQQRGNMRLALQRMALRRQSWRRRERGYASTSAPDLSTSSSASSRACGPEQRARSGAVPRA